MSHIIDPFEEHPEAEKSEKKEKFFLTKEEIFEIIDNKMEEISRKHSPTWGFSRYDLITAILSIKTEVEKCDE